MKSPSPRESASGFSAVFIRRPVATFLLAIGILIAGIVAYRFLPVAPMPSIDFPAIVVFAARPGADPETMATSIAGPLERRLGEISGVSELTSTSAVGSASIVILFDLTKKIDDAAHDVQAAINAATSDLPSDLPTRPYFRKFNPADAPVMTIALTSETLSTTQVYDAADSILAQRLSQIEGVAQVTVNGAEKPAVRVRLDPAAVAAAGLSGQDIYTAIRQANVTSPVGSFQGAVRSESIGTNGQLYNAADFKGLVLKNANGAVVRLSDVASVIDGTANTRLAAWYGKQPAILLNITKTADANVIETLDRVRAQLPVLQAWMPSGITLTVLSDRTNTIRASVDDVEITLLISIALVLVVVFIFMRRLVPTLAALCTVPLSIAGTLAAMWFEGFTLDNFSLMALTISVGFVVDDAIVMIENIVRHIEKGLSPMQAAFVGAKQIGFTVMSISLSLIAVFIPLLFYGGIPGKIMHEFAMTMTIAIAVSAVVSLSMTPMIMGQFLKPESPPRRTVWSRIDGMIDRAFRAVQREYAITLGWGLRHNWLMFAVTIATMVLTGYLWTVVPKGFLPTQDTGLIQGSTVANPDVSFAAMRERQRAVVDILLQDPGIATIGSTIGVSSGFSALNRGQLTIGLKPLAERDGVSSEAIITRLRPLLAGLGGVQTFLYSAQDFRGGGRGGSGNQFVLLDQNLAELREWTQRLTDKLRSVPEVTDVTSDQDRAAPQANVAIDRVAAARLGVSVAAIDNALNNAFAQRQISIIYSARNQYRVIEEVDPKLQTDPVMLSRIYVGATGGKQIPLQALVTIKRDVAPLSVNHQGQIAAATISFNSPPDVAAGTTNAAVLQAALDLHMPATIRTDFGGNSRFVSGSANSMPLLIAAAILTIYIVLGVLYESLTQPITILSTLPSAGLGALLALLITHTDMTMMAIIGILLLIGIVKKNAIMMVDFALEEEREHGRTPREAIHAACLERFRPIVMTTLAALLGALPLAIGFGSGAELRQPLGLTIVGGLIVSQMLTLYTTPVVYLALQRRGASKIVTYAGPAASS